MPNHHGMQTRFCLFDSICNDCPLSVPFSNTKVAQRRASGNIRAGFLRLAVALIIQIGAYFTAADVFKAGHKARIPKTAASAEYQISRRSARKWRDLFLSLICF